MPTSIPHAERQNDNQPDHWRNIISETFHDLFDKSWIQNIICGIILLLVAPLLTWLFMKNLRGILFGAGDRHNHLILDCVGVFD
jgi:hypothetical protein